MKLIRNDVDYSKLPPLPSVNDLKTAEDFQRLINTRGYRKPLDFMIDFGTGYKQLGLLGFRDKVVYPQDSKYQEYSNISIEEVQNIIDNNPSKISSLYQLGCVVSKFLVTYIVDNGWESSLHFKEITNNGEPPEEDIKETGGLLSLRHMTENLGGDMTIYSEPAFKIKIILRDDVNREEV